MPYDPGIIEQRIETEIRRLPSDKQKKILLEFLIIKAQAIRGFAAMAGRTLIKLFSELNGATPAQIQAELLSLVNSQEYLDLDARLQRLNALFEAFYQENNKYHPLIDWFRDGPIKFMDGIESAVKSISAVAEGEVSPQEISRRHLGLDFPYSSLSFEERLGIHWLPDRLDDPRADDAAVCVEARPQMGCSSGRCVAGC
jgi:hypothetical protein